jgi:citrate lyase beta subunit
MMLSLITDDAALAGEAERAGIDRIMIDLEREGKAERQAGRSLFQSTHQLKSVCRVKAALDRAALMVRINPLSERTRAEIEAVLAGGADVIMLPYFFTPADVRSFVAMVDGRSRVSVLVETKSAAEQLAACLTCGRIDEVHIGLNDLSIELGCDVMLEPMCTGVIDRLAATLREARVPFGVGGIARLSSETLPVRPERLLAEQVRLGCTRAWLGRTFRDGLRGSQLAAEVDRIRDAVARWGSAPEESLRENRAALVDEIQAWKARTNLPHRPSTSVGGSMLP